MCPAPAIVSKRPSGSWLASATPALSDDTPTVSPGLARINERLAQFDPNTGYRPNLLLPKRVNNDPGTLYFLAFSGGGTRAAAFSYGVLEELRRTEVVIDGQRRRLIDEVDIISGVSGGSFTALAYSLYGERLYSKVALRIMLSDFANDISTLPTVTTEAPVQLDGNWNAAPPNNGTAYGPISAATRLAAIDASFDPPRTVKSSPPITTGRPSTRARPKTKLLGTKLARSFLSS